MLYSEIKTESTTLLNNSMYHFLQEKFYQLYDAYFYNV